MVAPQRFRRYRAGIREQQGRVRGNDELRSLLGEIGHHREQRELALRRERHFRIVEDKVKDRLMIDELVYAQYYD